MTYWFLTSGNSQRDYSTFFEASIQCYNPLGKSPWCMSTVDKSFISLLKVFFSSRPSLTDLFLQRDENKELLDFIQ